MSKSLILVAIVSFVLSIACGHPPEKKALIGGKRDIDINEDENAKEFLNYAVSQYNKDNDGSMRQVSQVWSASKQVVAGMKYTFNVNMAKNNCTMASENEVCVIYQDPEKAQAYNCTFTVWSRPWLKSTIVTEKCNNENTA